MNNLRTKKHKERKKMFDDKDFNIFNQMQE